MTTCGGCVHSNQDHSQITGFCTHVDCDCIWTEPTITYPVMMDDDTHCCYCSRPIPPGFPYSQVLTGFMPALKGLENTFDDTKNQWPMYDIVCVYCTEEDDVEE